jgi:hypothetical protein
MPCRDGREAPIDPDATTRFCCEMLGRMEDVGDPIPAYIQTWWEDHKKWDEWRDSDYRGPMPEFKSRRW